MSKQVKREISREVRIGVWDLCRRHVKDVIWVKIVAEVQAPNSIRTSDQVSTPVFMKTDDIINRDRK